eukprot:TRINITY_DN227_c0_g3_i1.p1 TRINITY_DN227_c0_g3~~TRINITY_DN227_c0_g3_i1.p1  ORF type:complete len:704 (-),score=272.53 TRINITY_DN227_c0_g3_i1:41-2152(-)
MKLQLLFVFSLLALSTNAFDWTGGSGNFSDAFGSGTITGDFNINSALSIFTVTIDAETTLDGTLNIGGGLLNFGPTLAIEALTTIGNLTMDAGEIIVAAGSKLVVTGDFAITSAVEIVGEVEVQGKLLAESAVTFGSETAANATVTLTSTSDAIFEDAVVFYSHLVTGAYAVFDTSFTAHGSVHVEVGSVVEFNQDATVEFKGAAIIEGELKAETEVLFNAASEAAVVIKGTTHTAESIVLDGLAAAEVAADVVINAAVTVRGDATLEIKNQLEIQGNFVVEAGAWVKAESDLIVETVFELGEGAILEVSSTGSALFKSACAIEGEIHAEASVTFDAEAEADVIFSGANHTATTLFFKGAALAKVTGETVFDAAVEVSAGASFEVTAKTTVAKSLVIEATSSLKASSELIVDGAFELKADAEADIEAEAEAIFNAATTLVGSLHVSGSVSFSAKVTMSSDTTVETDGEATFEGDADIDAAFLGDGDITFGGNSESSVKFSSQSQKAKNLVFTGLAWAENSVDVIFDAAVTVKGEATFEAKKQVNVTGDFIAEGSAYVICSAGDIHAHAKFTLGASTTYAVTIASEVESEIKRVKSEGEAELDGTVEIEVSVELEAEVTIMEFSARGETEFSAVAVVSASNKRGLMSTEETGEEEEDNDDYEINYGDKSVTVGPKGVSVDESEDDSSSAVVVITLIAVVLSLLV